MNSLIDSREFFYDPETAGSSGLSHIPSQPVGIPSLRGMSSLDSCLQPDTRNSFGISGNVFEDLPAPGEPPAALFGNSRSSASAQCEPVSLNKGRFAERANELERAFRKFAIHTPRFCKEVFNLESSISGRRSLSAKLHG